MSAVTAPEQTRLPPTFLAEVQGRTATDVLDLLSFAKGVAILWIVGVHGLRGWFGWQGVHVFIVLGGFGLAYSRLTGRQEPWGKWIRRRMARILPAYWLVAALGALAIALFGSARIGAGEAILLDGLLLRNVGWRTMFGDVNAALWYVPFLASMYLAFPWLFGHVASDERAGALIKIVLITAAIEFVYRAGAIWMLDGVPVGFGHGFLRFLPKTEGFDLIPDAFPFQKWAPFGWFPSRIGEFTLGLVGAALLVRRPHTFAAWIFRPTATLAGLGLWLAGNFLVHVGPAGWIFADWLLAAGLVLWLMNAAHAARRWLPGAFRRMSRLGEWSFHLFLTHLLVGYIASQLVQSLGIRSPLPFAGLAMAAIAAVVASTVLLRRVDHWVAARAG